MRKTLVRLLSYYAVLVLLFLVPLTTLAGAPSLNASKLWQRSARSLQSTGQATSYITNRIVVGKIDGSVTTVPVDSAGQLADTLAYWQTQPDVKYAELDGRMMAYGQQATWGYNTVQATTAHTNSATGSGVVVAVVDTGVDYGHEDLIGNIWVNSDETPSNNIDDDVNGYVDDYYGYDFIGDSPTNLVPDHDPMDDAGHGTHVSGIIAAVDNTTGVIGVATQAKIMPVKVLDGAGYGSDYTVAQGIRYAADNGANVINLSLGSTVSSTTLKSAIDYAVNAGVLVIAAAGNAGSFTFPSYPAAYANVISVAASDEDGMRAYYSNAGKVDVIAPGDMINSTLIGNTYGIYSGTSMAAPFVTGVAALVRQKQGLTNVQAIRQVIQTTTTDFGLQTGPDNTSGYGIVNAVAATGTLTSSSAMLYSDASWIKSDGSDDAVITVSVRDSTGAVLVGNVVTWSTTKGTLSATTSTTDINGLASVTLTANNTSGLAVITVQPTNVTATSIMQTIMTDIPQPDTIGVSKVMATSSNLEIPSDTTADTDTSSTTNLENNLLAPGDKVSFWAQATSYDHAEHKTKLTYSLSDSIGNVMVSGTSPRTTVGTNYDNMYIIAQTKITSKPVVLPDTLANGKYTVTITLTDQTSNESSTRTTTVWVGEYPDILVVNANPGSCLDTPVEGYDLGGNVMCTAAAYLVLDTLENAGYSAMLWDSLILGEPTDSDLALFPAVIWLDPGLSYVTSTALINYLDNGGNVLLSSALLASNETMQLPTDSDFLWNYLHAHYVKTLMQPNQVIGAAGSDFSGLSFNTDYYNLNGNGSRTNFYAAELELNDVDSAQALFNYTVGDSTSKVAGLKVDNGTYRLAFLPFSVAAINDVSGNATKSYVLSTLTNWLLGGAPSITELSQRKLKNNLARTITVTGDNFSTVGTTTVKLGNKVLSDVVVSSRTSLTATVPAGMKTGSRWLTVTNPNGQIATSPRRIKTLKGGVVLDAVTPTLVTNDGEQWLTFTGAKFKRTTKVMLGDTVLTKKKYTSRNELSVLIPTTIQPGTYALKIKNLGIKRVTRYSDIIVRQGLTELLKVGDKTTQVKVLEARLKKFGYLKEKANTDFTKTTKQALLRYQHDNNLKETGATDYLTRHYLNILEPAADSYTDTTTDSTSFPFGIK
ncbi:MAG: S8 family serine peptidase [Patescibacteria group bacterium]|jgi:subtilisin family serine protease